MQSSELSEDSHVRLISSLIHPWDPLCNKLDIQPRLFQANTAKASSRPLGTLHPRPDAIGRYGHASFSLQEVFVSATRACQSKPVNIDSSVYPEPGQRLLADVAQCGVR